MERLSHGGDTAVSSREGPTTSRPRGVGNETPPCEGLQGRADVPSEQQEKLRIGGILLTSGQNSRESRARIGGFGGVGDCVSLGGDQSPEGQMISAER